jgi:hypothetical protein
MTCKPPSVLRIRWVIALLLSLLGVTMGSGTALAERGDFWHSSLAANSGVLNASRGIPKTGVAHFDQLAVESSHFDRAISAIKARGFKVREAPLGASNPAFIKPGNRTFYYDPKHMTHLDLRHEINHLQQFKQTGSMRIGGGRGARLEFGSYMFERSLGVRHGFSGEYMNYLEGQLSGYGSKFMKP